MQNAKVITLALLITAGGLFSTAAQGAGPYYDNVRAMDYPLHERFLNPPRFAYTAGLPTISNLDLESLSGAVATDGSGRIGGQVYARIYFGAPNNKLTDYGAFTITVTGKTQDNGTNPQVKITMKGNGYDFDGRSNHANASLSLKFTSKSSLEDVPPREVQITSANYSVTYADGSTQLFTDGPTTRTNSAYTFLSGTLKGNIKPGKNSDVNNGNQINVDETGVMVTARTNWLVIGTNVIQQCPGGLILEVLRNIDAQVIQPVSGSKLHMNANVGSLMQLHYAKGTATYSSARWSASFSGVAFARGSRLQANGNLGPLIVAYDLIPGTTNYVPRIVQDGIRDMKITSGKILGQKVPKIEGVSLQATPP